MANATLGTGAGQWTIDSGETLSYTTSGVYLAYFKFSADKQEVEEFSANGVDGYGTKRHGARDGQISLSIYNVQTTDAKCVTGILDKVNDLASSGVISYTVAGIPGIGRILGDQCSVDQPRSVGNGLYRTESAVIIRKVRSS
jgi:hypothetical protein